MTFAQLVPPKSQKFLAYFANASVVEMLLKRMEFPLPQEESFGQTGCVIVIHQWFAFYFRSHWHKFNNPLSLKNRLLVGSPYRESNRSGRSSNHVHACALTVTVECAGLFPA
jgi:hypothetical protein